MRLTTPLILLLLSSCSSAPVAVQEHHHSINPGARLWCKQMKDESKECKRLMLE